MMKRQKIELINIRGRTVQVSAQVPEGTVWAIHKARNMNGEIGRRPQGGAFQITHIPTGTHAANGTRKQCMRMLARLEALGAHFFEDGDKGAPLPSKLDVVLVRACLERADNWEGILKNAGFLDQDA